MALDTFVMVARDVDESAALRAEFGEAHVAYVTKLHEEGRIVLAGPRREPDGETSKGAVIVFRAKSLEAAKDWVAGDPYMKGGVFADVHVDRFLKVFVEDA